MALFGEPPPPPSGWLCVCAHQRSPLRRALRLLYRLSNRSSLRHFFGSVSHRNLASAWHIHIPPSQLPHAYDASRHSHGHSPPSSASTAHWHGAASVPATRFPSCFRADGRSEGHCTRGRPERQEIIQNPKTDCAVPLERVTSLLSQHTKGPPYIETPHLPFHTSPPSPASFLPDRLCAVSQAQSRGSFTKATGWVCVPAALCSHFFSPVLLPLIQGLRNKNRSVKWDTEPPDARLR